MRAPLPVAAPPLPRYLQIEPVGQCNLRCRMCSVQYRQDGPPFGPPAFLDFGLFERLLAENPRLTQVHLQGLGEPLMHPRFFDMVAAARRRGIHVSTNSNLTLLNERRAELMVTSGLNELHVSIDGATAATYEFIRVRARFDRLEQNHRRLLAARRWFGSVTPQLQLVTVIMRQNLHELPQLVRLAAEWEFETMWVQHLAHDFQETGLPGQYAAMRSFVDEQSLLGLDPSLVEDVFARAQEVAAEYYLDLRLPRVLPRSGMIVRSGRERCDWPWERAYVAYDGSVMPCCMIATPDRLNFGTAGRGLRPIWESPAVGEFRERLDSANPPDICRSCAVYNGTF